MKKWLILALTIIFLVSLVGCRPESQPDSQSDSGGGVPIPDPNGEIVREPEPDEYPPVNIIPNVDPIPAPPQ